MMPEAFSSPLIYCIGDSHISFFSGKDAIQPVWPKDADNELSIFRTFHIGSALAFNLPRNNTSTRGREKLLSILEEKVPINSTVLLSFGEIDCRAQIVKHAHSQNSSIAEVVDTCLDEYCKTINEVIQLGFNVIVYNAILSRPRERKVVREGHNSYPAHGTLGERTEAINRFNQGLKKRCEELGARFLANASVLADSKGKIPVWYFFDNIHLSQRAMPVTMQELSRLFPSWDLEVPPPESPSGLNIFTNLVTRRAKRIIKEISKIWK